jgi:hypothetical protein
MNDVPPYLVNNIDWLIQQWNTKVNQWKIDATKQPQTQFHSKIDAVSFEGLKREGTIQIGSHTYNPSTIIHLLNELSSVQGVSPPVGETGVSLDDFIRSTIRPDPTSIILYINDGPTKRKLNQVELNWFFSGSYEPHNQTPIEGLKDPQRAPISVPELIHIYNVFFKPSQTRSGKHFGVSDGGKTIKRKKAQRANKKYRSTRRTRRLSSKRTTKRAKRSTRRHRRHRRH